MLRASRTCVKSAESVEPGLNVQHLPVLQAFKPEAPYYCMIAVLHSIDAVQ